MRGRLWSAALATVVLGVSLGGGCRDPADEIYTRDLSAQEHQRVAAINGFGFRLFQEVVDRSTSGNVVVSPLSVSLALGMTYNGAAGETEAAMAETLGATGMAREELNQAYHGLIDLLTRMDPKVRMEIACSIWYREGFEVEPAFIDVNQTWFDAEVEALDFSAPDAADLINGWVDDQTHGKITEIVDDPIDADARLFLINAMYFKGTWTVQFDKGDTHDAEFHLADGTSRTVDMMKVVSDLSYHRGPGFQAVDLAYGGALFHMAVILPDPGKDLDELIGEVNDETWADLEGEFQITDVDLHLPRFELDFGTSLKDALGALGMEVAFTPEADFTGINPQEPLVIQDVKHKTYVKVNEEGTEAAAVTSVGGYVVTSVPMPTPLIVDRPFLFVIHDHHTRTVLFLGKVADPTAAL